MNGKQKYSHNSSTVNGLCCFVLSAHQNCPMAVPRGEEYFQFRKM